MYERPVTLSKSRSKCQSPVRNLQCPPKPQLRTQMTWMFFAPSISRESQNSDHCCIKNQCLYPKKDQDVKPESGTSSVLQAPTQDLKDMVVVCTFQTKIESWIWNMGVSEASDHIQINIRMPNPSQEPPASSKAPTQDSKDMDVLCTFKIKIESQDLEHWYIKNQ